MLKSLLNNSTQRILTCLFVPSRHHQPCSNSRICDSASITGYPGFVQVTNNFHTTSTSRNNGDLISKGYLDHFFSSSKEDANIHIHKPETDAKFGFPTKDTPMMKVGDELYKDLHIVYIAAIKTNVIMTLTTANGKTITTVTAGGQGLKNKRESTQAAAQLVASRIVQKTEELHIKNIRVCLKGHGNGRETGLKTLSLSGLNVVSITDNTQLPFGGNRPSALRK